MEQEHYNYDPTEGYVKRKPRIRVPRGLNIATLATKSPEEVARVALENFHKKRSSKGPKRPRSSYMCFVHHHGRELLAKLEARNFAPLGKLLGETWNRMSPEAKKVGTCPLQCARQARRLGNLHFTHGRGVFMSPQKYQLEGERNKMLYRRAKAEQRRKKKASKPDTAQVCCALGGNHSEEK